MTIGTQIDNETINMSLRKRQIVTTRLAGLSERQKIAEGEHQRKRRQLLIDENRALLDANVKLKEQLEETNDLVTFWANDSEAFRRTLRHLQGSWTPKAEAESDVAKIVATEHAGVRNNTEWQEQRKAISEKQISKRRETKKKTRPG